MMRGTLILLAALTLLPSWSVASDTVAVAAARKVEAPARSLDLEEFLFNEQSEVLCNGQPARYEDVPETAVITRLEVAADRRTIVRIHFRTR